MTSKIELISENLSSKQLRLAVGIQEKEIGRIEAETIGWKWNARQKHMLHILGDRALQTYEGTHIAPLTVKDFEEEMEVTLPTIQADIKGLLGAKMIEKNYLDGSRRTKTVQLTENGFALWREYANKRAALVFTMHDALKKTGDVPKAWRSKIRSWVTSLIGDKAKAAAIAVMCLGLAGVANESKADFSAPVPMFVENVGFDGSHAMNAMKAGFQTSHTNTLAANWMLGNDVDVIARSGENPQYALAKAATGYVEYDGVSSSIKMASTEGLYDRLLTKVEIENANGLSGAFASVDYSTTVADWGRMFAKPVFLGEASKSRMQKIVPLDFQYGMDNDFSSALKLADVEGLYDRLLPKAVATGISDAGWMR